MNALSPAHALTAVPQLVELAARGRPRAAPRSRRPRRLAGRRVLHVPREAHLARLLGLDARQLRQEALDRSVMRQRYAVTARRRPGRLSSEGERRRPGSRLLTARAPVTATARRYAAGATVLARSLRSQGGDAPGAGARPGSRRRPRPAGRSPRPTSWGWARPAPGPPGGTASSTPTRTSRARRACPRRSTSSTGSGSGECTDADVAAYHAYFARPAGQARRRVDARLHARRRGPRRCCGARRRTRGCWCCCATPWSASGAAARSPRTASRSGASPRAAANAGLPAGHLRRPAAAPLGGLPARAGARAPVRALRARTGRGAPPDVRVPGPGPGARRAPSTWPPWSTSRAGPRWT